MDHNYKCVVWWAPGNTISVGGTPDVVDLIPVDAQGSTCMRRGESLSAGQFTYVAQVEFWQRQVDEVVRGHW